MRTDCRRRTTGGQKHTVQVIKLSLIAWIYALETKLITPSLSTKAIPNADQSSINATNQNECGSYYIHVDNRRHYQLGFCLAAPPPPLRFAFSPSQKAKSCSFGFLVV